MNDRVVFITGGAQGLGEGIARVLYSRGARVALADINDELLQATAAKIEPDDSRLVALTVDVRDKDDLDRAFARVVSRWGKVDVMINNAARTVHRPFFEIEKDEWDDVLAVNLRGVLFGCQIAGDHMKERSFGRIVNVSSLAGQQGGHVAGAHYAASKAGIIVLTKIVARELATFGVTANAIAPGPIQTPIVEAMPEADVSRLAASVPVGRVATPSEIAEVVAFLVSEESGFITGATIDANGGLHMR